MLMFDEFVNIFDTLIKHEHPIEICANDPESHLWPLTSVECCALRYVAGYTIRKVLFNFAFHTSACLATSSLCLL